MTERLADKYETRGAGLVQRLVLLDEELRPVPGGVSPATLVTRVNERLIQVACAIEFEEDDEEGRLKIAAFFFGAAAFALSAVAHLHGDPDELAACKDRLLDQLDEDVAEGLEENAEFYETLTADTLLRYCLAMMVGACQCVTELEGVQALPDDEAEREALTVEDVLEGGDTPSAGEEDWRERLLTEAGDSLWQTAIAATAGAQWLLEQDEA
jgi:hypothetical protein